MGIRKYVRELVDQFDAARRRLEVVESALDRAMYLGEKLPSVDSRIDAHAERFERWVEARLSVFEKRLDGEVGLFARLAAVEKALTTAQMLPDASAGSDASKRGPFRVCSVVEHAEILAGIEKLGGKGMLQRVRLLGRGAKTAAPRDTATIEAAILDGVTREAEALLADDASTIEAENSFLRAARDRARARHGLAAASGIARTPLVRTPNGDVVTGQAQPSGGDAIPSPSSEASEASEASDETRETREAREAQEAREREAQEAKDAEHDASPHVEAVHAILRRVERAYDESFRKGGEAPTQEVVKDAIRDGYARWRAVQRSALGKARIVARTAQPVVLGQSRVNEQGDVVRLSHLVVDRPPGYALIPVVGDAPDLPPEGYLYAETVEERYPIVLKADVVDASTLPPADRQIRTKSETPEEAPPKPVEAGQCRANKSGDVVRVERVESESMRQGTRGAAVTHHLVGIVGSAPPNDANDDYVLRHYPIVLREPVLRKSLLDPNQRLGGLGLRPPPSEPSSVEPSSEVAEGKADELATVQEGAVVRGTAFSELEPEMAAVLACIERHNREKDEGLSLRGIAHAMGKTNHGYFAPLVRMLEFRHLIVSRRDGWWLASLAPGWPRGC